MYIVCFILTYKRNFSFSLFSLYTLILFNYSLYCFSTIQNFVLCKSDWAAILAYLKIFCICLGAFTFTYCWRSTGDYWDIDDKNLTLFLANLIQLQHCYRWTNKNKWYIFIHWSHIVAIFAYNLNKILIIPVKVHASK